MSRWCHDKKLSVFGAILLTVTELCMQNMSTKSCHANLISRWRRTVWPISTISSISSRVLHRTETCLKVMLSTFLWSEMSTRRLHRYYLRAQTARYFSGQWTVCGINNQNYSLGLQNPRRTWHVGLLLCDELSSGGVSFVKYNDDLKKELLCRNILYDF